MNIVGIVDLDGFFVQKTFFCQELGIITHGDMYGTLFHFNTALCYKKLNKKDRIQVKFLQEHIHGLLLKNKTDTYKHCPHVEVEAYLHWLTKYWMPKYYL